MTRSFSRIIYKQLFMEIILKKILIIDDSMFAVKVLTDILKDTYEVISAENGKKGILLAMAKQPALILLDIEMPEMDGFEVLKVLKEEQATKVIPVIFLTGIIDSEYEERGFLCGAVDYIRKPYNSNVVKVRVKTHINLAEYGMQIEKQLNIDMLTGILNRRGLEKHLKEVAVKALEEQFAFNCIMFDLDYFKRINDTYGHLQGDRALQQVADILKSCVPKSKGYVSRYGGEEFAVILKKTDFEEIKSVMRRIYEQTEAAHIPNEKSDICPYLTISAGGAGRMLTHTDEALDIVDLADKMLYKSKNTGRNRFTWYQKDETVSICY